MFERWVLTSWESVGWVVFSTLAMYAAIIAITRLNGPRSFAKMSAFDFATTVAIGTLLGSTIVSENPSVLRGVVAVSALLGLQHLIARLRVAGRGFRRGIDNSPLLLMRDGEILHDNLRASRVAESDLWFQLRAANVGDVGAVRAVVLETTGEVSVLHGDAFDQRLLRGVTGWSVAPEA